jgi:hypothetical protein
MTKREREVIELIAEGLSNKEIAQQLNIATYTVKSHVHNILDKLALHTRLQGGQLRPRPRRFQNPVRIALPQLENDSLIQKNYPLFHPLARFSFEIASSILLGHRHLSKLGRRSQAR